MHGVATLLTWLGLIAGIVAVGWAVWLRRRAPAGPDTRRAAAVALLGASIILATGPRVANCPAWVVLLFSLLALLPLAGFVFALRTSDRR